LIAESAPLYSIDSLTTSPNDRPSVRHQFSVHRDATLQGFWVWFDTVLSGEVTLSTYPPGVESWDNVFFPLSEPVPVAMGDEVELVLSAVHPPATDPTLSWTTTIRPGNNGSSRTFRQSTFNGVPLSTGDLQTIRQATRPS